MLVQNLEDDKLVRRYDQKGIKMTPRRPYQKERYDKDHEMEERRKRDQNRTKEG